MCITRWTDPRNDTTKFYKRTGKNGDALSEPIDRSAFEKIEKSEKDKYVEIREAINHPNISGPFDTGWDYTDFGGNGFDQRIGPPRYTQLVSLQVRVVLEG